MEDSIRQYLEVANTPQLTEYVDECTDEIVDVFSQSTGVVDYSEVKSLLITKFKEVMIASGVSNYIIDKRDVDFDCLTAKANRRRELTRETRRIEELRETIAEKTVDITIDTRKLKHDIKKWADANPACTEVLCYGILDLVTEPNPGTMEILHNDTDKLLATLPNIKIDQNEACMVKKYTLNILQSLSTDHGSPAFYQQLKCAISKAKKENNNDNSVSNNNATSSHSKDNDTGSSQNNNNNSSSNSNKKKALTRTTKLRVIKLLNVYRHQIRTNGKNMLLLPMTEGNYMITFVGPLFDTLLRNDDSLEIMWGETKLKAAQNIDNDAFDDGQRRCASANVDGKITTTKTNVELLLFEISGPPLSHDYLHFIDDRKKLALNMKKIIHDIINRHTTGKKSLLFKIKIYGLHFYDHTLYVYSMNMPKWGLYVFQQEKQLKLPVHPCTIKSTLPHLTKTLYQLLVSYYNSFLV